MMSPDRSARPGRFRRQLLACSLALGTPAAAQPDGFMRHRSEQGVRLALAIASYASSHENALPPDLGATLEGFLDGSAAPAEIVRARYLGPGFDPKKVPAEPDAAWVNEHSSFTYLGGGGINPSEVPDWGGTVIAHLRMDEAAEAEPGNPDSAMVALIFPDGHLEWAAPVEARRRIDESSRILDAVRTGGPFPEALQSEWNLRTITAAIRAYAAAHGGLLPPDLGATLAHLPADPKRLATPQQRAASTFPRAMRGVPQYPTTQRQSG